MSTMNPYGRNFGAAAADYARHRAGVPDSLFERLAQLGVGLPRQCITDIGTGTGMLGRGFARRGARVIGVDPDARMLEQARELDRAAGVASEYRVGRAEQLPLDDDALDVISAAQCWHWFQPELAAREMARACRASGRVAIVHFDWLPLPGSLVEATERLIEAHNPKWDLGGGDGFHPESLPYLRAAGFGAFEQFSYEVDVPYTPEGWRGRIRASAGVGASLSPETIAAFDEEHARVIAQRFAGETVLAPHRVFAIVGERLGKI
ncbi:MAG TPA: class I SAM-dependent methyltransferase [Nevskiaceae bacterium]|nr:class I SAM-dependent methyltransferase [Nevskiaceae bacterium]